LTSRATVIFLDGVPQPDTQCERSTCRAATAVWVGLHLSDVGGVSASSLTRAANSLNGVVDGIALVIVGFSHKWTGTGSGTSVIWTWPNRTEPGSRYASLSANFLMLKMQHTCTYCLTTQDIQLRQEFLLGTVVEIDCHRQTTLSFVTYSVEYFFSLTVPFT